MFSFWLSGQNVYSIVCYVHATVLYGNHCQQQPFHQSSQHWAPIIMPKWHPHLDVCQMKDRGVTTPSSKCPDVWSPGSFSLSTSRLRHLLSNSVMKWFTSSSSCVCVRFDLQRALEELMHRWSSLISKLEEERIVVFFAAFNERTLYACTA